MCRYVNVLHNIQTLAGQEILKKMGHQWMTRAKEIIQRVVGWPATGDVNSFLRLIHTYHAVPAPCQCRSPAMPCQKLIFVSFPFDLHSGAAFDSHMPRRARAMPRTYRSESDFLRPRNNAAWAWHGMCELPSAVHRRHVDDLPVFGFFRLPRGVPRSVLSEAY
jgi:hypothetical protein